MFISCSSTGMKSANSSYEKSNDGIVFNVKLSNKNTKREPANLETLGDNPNTLLNRIVRACQTNDMEYLGVAFHHFGDDSPEDTFNKSSSQSKDDFRTYLQTGSFPASNPSSCAHFAEGLLDSAFLYFSSMEQSSDYFRPILSAANISSFDRGSFLNRIEAKMQSCEPYMNYNAFLRLSKTFRENRLFHHSVVLKNSPEEIELLRTLRTLVLEQETYSSSSQQAIDCTDYAIGAYTTIYVNMIAKFAGQAIAETMGQFVTDFGKALGTTTNKILEASVKATTEVTIGLTEAMAKGAAESLEKNIKKINPDQNK